LASVIVKDEILPVFHSRIISKIGTIADRKTVPPMLILIYKLGR
jgi:hypothetical protein